MTKQFASYEVAKLMKQLGFNEPCFGYFPYNAKGLKTEVIPADKEQYRWLFDEINVITNSELQSLAEKGLEGLFSAPLYQQVIDWILLKGYVVAYKSDKTILDNDLLVMLEYLLKKEQTEE